MKHTSTLSILAISALLSACGSSSSDSDDNNAKKELSLKSAFDVTNPTDSAQVYKYFGDSAAGTMDGPSNYGALAYGIKEGDHKMWPNFTTYIFKDADTFYKAQIISNYGQDGTRSSGNLYIRYAQIDDTDTGITSYATIDASGGKAPAYLSFDSGSEVTADLPWHLSYQKSVGFTVNGGTSGNGNITACIAHTPDGLYNDKKEAIDTAFKALNADNTLAQFESINAAACDEFTADSIKTYIQWDDWMNYDGRTPATVNTSTKNGWLIRSATADDNSIYQYGRVKVHALDYQRGVRQALTFSVEQWDNNAQVFSDAQISPELDFTTQRQYWDMETNSLVNENDDWELSATVNGRSFDIQVNASVSGTGTAGVGHVLLDEE